MQPSSSFRAVSYALMAVRISNPWQHHEIAEVLEPGEGQASDAEEGRLLPERGMNIMKGHCK